MKGLSKTWLTDPWIDAEYKSYILLAYLQEVGLNFEQQKLYPYLTELIEHFREAKMLRQSTESAREQFPRQLTGISIENFRLNYERIVNDDLLLEEVIRTVDFSLPKMEVYIREGKEIYEFVEKNISVLPVGLIPLNNQEGYFFLENRSSNTTDVYEYNVTIFESVQDKYRSLQSSFLVSYPISLSNTYPFIKSELIRNRKEIPNPATYAFETDIHIPISECFLPVARRILMRTISEA